MMWPLVIGTEKEPGALRPIDRMEWKIDDAQAEAWIYVNLEDSQHNHNKGLGAS